MEGQCHRVDQAWSTSTWKFDPTLQLNCACALCSVAWIESLRDQQVLWQQGRTEGRVLLERFKLGSHPLVHRVDSSINCPRISWYPMHCHTGLKVTLQLPVTGMLSLY
eukprot:6404013-Amphidinium_carterae.1